MTALLLPDIATLEVVLSMVDGSTVDSFGVLGVWVRSIEQIDCPKFVGSVVLPLKVPSFHDGKLFPVILRVLIASRVKELESSSSIVTIVMRVVVA